MPPKTRTQTASEQSTTPGTQQPTPAAEEPVRETIEEESGESDDESQDSNPEPGDTYTMAAAAQDVKGFKPIPPNKYDGSTDVDDFTLVAEIYLRFYSSSFPHYTSKILGLSRLFTGQALAWL